MLSIGLALLVFVASCGVEFEPAFEGRPPPDDEIALLTSDKLVTINAIDGREVDGEAYKFKAGRHLLRVTVVRAEAFASCNPFFPILLACTAYPAVDPSPMIVEFEAEAGHQYHVTGKFLRSDDGRDTVYIHVEDLTTRETVGKAER